MDVLIVAVRKNGVTYDRPMNHYFPKPSGYTPEAFSVVRDENGILEVETVEELARHLHLLMQ